MIGFLEGQVLFSDGNQCIIKTTTGHGYEVFINQVLSEGTEVCLYITHIIRENLENLFGFKTLQEKKAFELVLSVKGVGPKSAYSLISTIGVEGIIKAVTFDDKKTLQKAPGVGAKAAAQIILDLTSKIPSLQMYMPGYKALEKELSETNEVFDNKELQLEFSSQGSLIDDTLMACKELGFREDTILPLAQKMLEEHKIQRPEQLVHLVLKEL